MSSNAKETHPAKTSLQDKGQADIFGAMRHEMNNVLDRFETGWPQFPAAIGRMFGRDVLSPQLDVRENGTEVKIDIELPGVDEKDVSVTLSDGVLRIKGEKKGSHDESDENFHFSERHFGSFERLVRLPDTIDDASMTADFENGVLHIAAKKKPSANKPQRKIEINNVRS